MTTATREKKKTSSTMSRKIGGNETATRIKRGTSNEDKIKATANGKWMKMRMMRKGGRTGK